MYQFVPNKSFTIVISFLFSSGLKRVLENAKAQTIKQSTDLIDGVIKLGFRIMHCSRSKRQNIEALLEED